MKAKRAGQKSSPEGGFKLRVSPDDTRKTARTAYFSNLFTMAPVSYITISQQGLILEANSMAARLLGVNLSEPIKPTLSEFILKEDQPLFAPFLEQLFECAEPQAVELRMLQREGTVFWSRLEANASQQDNGSPVGLLVVSDINQRKQLEEATRIQRDLCQALGGSDDLHEALELILDAALRHENVDSGGIYLADPSGALDLAVQRGLSPQFIEHATHYSAEAPQTCLARQGKASFGTYANFPAKSDMGDVAEGLLGLAIIPVLYQGQLLALLNVASHTHDEIPSNTRLALETLAQQVGSSLMRLRADSVVRESRQNLQTLLDTVSDCLFVLDGTGRILETSAMVRNQLGYSAAELLGQDVLLVHPPDQRSEAAAVLADMLAGKRDTCLIPLQTKDGDLIPVETSVASGLWSGKSALFCLSRDITRRSRAEAALRESEANLRAVFNATDESMLLVATDGTLLALNDIAAQRMGNSPEALIGLKVGEVLPPEVIACRRPFIERVLLTGLPMSFEGERGGRWMTNHLHPILDSAGQVIRLAIFSRDITAGKRAEDALLASESRFRAIIDAFPVPMALNDEQQHITFLNPAFVQTFGYTQKDLPTLSEWWPRAYPAPKYRQWVVDSWQAELEWAKQTGAPFRPLELTVRCKAGTDKTVLASAAKLANSFEGDHLVVLHDITARKGTEEALRDAHWRLESIIEATRLGTWEWNVQTGETHLNEVWAQLIGYTLEELMPSNIKTWDALTHPDDLKQSGDLLERHFIGELPYYDCECRLKHKQGHWVWVHDRGRVITRTAHGLPLLMFGTHTDISARKQAEAALQTALSDIRTLRGILPICARCKDIRDDKGDWRPLEVYVSQRTEAEFSHGLCPECMARLYPEYVEEADEITAPQ